MWVVFLFVITVMMVTLRPASLVLLIIPVLSLAPDHLYCNGHHAREEEVDQLKPVLSRLTRHS